MCILTIQNVLFWGERFASSKKMLYLCKAKKKGI